MHLGIGTLGYTGNQEFSVLTHLVPVSSTVRFASLPMVSATTDTPASTFVEGRLGQIEVRRGLATTQEGRFSGVMVQTASEITLQSTDGELDYLFDNYVFRDRPVTIKAARSTRSVDGREVAPALATFETMFKGLAADIRIERDHLSIRVEDGMRRLDKPIRKTIYEGLGGRDGGADLKGQHPPLSYGRCDNILPTLVDAFNGIYQVHDGEIKVITTVKDRGVPLGRARDVDTYAELEALVRQGEDVETPDILVGEYATCIKEGFFRLGGLPAGIVTADVEGDGINDGPVTFSGGVLFQFGVGWSQIGTRTHSRYAGGIILRILTTRANFAVHEVDIDRAAQFDRENPYDVNLFVATGQDITIRDAVAQLADSVGAVLYWTKLGQVALIALDGPAPGAVINVSGAQIAQDGVQVVPLPYTAPWAYMRLRKNINWMTMTEDQIALDAPNRAFLTQPASYAEIVDKTIEAIFPDRPVLAIDTLLKSDAAAQIIATRLQGFYSLNRMLYKVVVRGFNFRLDFFDTIRVTYPRFGLSGGKRLLVVEIAERPGFYETELLLFG